jgi:hypothetical protein
MVVEWEALIFVELLMDDVSLFDEQLSIVMVEKRLILVQDV